MAPPLCPPFFLLRGYPTSAKLVVGRPPHRVLATPLRGHSCQGGTFLVQTRDEGEECPPTAVGGVSLAHNPQPKLERDWMRISLRFIVAIVLLFIAAVLAGCAGAPVTQSVPAVAVWDPEDLSPGAAGEQGIGEVLALRIVETVRARGLAVVERQKLLLAVEELRLGSSSLADESTRLRLGRITGARRMVFGGYLTAGNRIRMDLRLVDVETGKVLRTASRTSPAGGIDALLGLCGKAADDLFP